METIKLTIPSDIPHISQIITGFLILKEQGWKVEIVDRSKDVANPFYDLPVVLVEYRGKTIVYDLWDGYQNPEGIRKGLDVCDFYFKRSFSAEKNEKLFPDCLEKIYPLGFNYHLTHKDNPINEPAWKAMIKPLLGRAPDKYFVPEVFEGRAKEKQGGTVKILFLTRLWDSKDPAESKEANEERAFINETRIHIIRTLKERYGDAFLGGLNDTPVSRELAPELIVAAKYTERKKYVQLLHESDICIGTMGLHESIGWKTAEYVAAAKAIVNEYFRYSVPGDFREGENYLTFATAEECIAAVQKLVEDPALLYHMKKNNEVYYRSYLKPEVLVQNSLKMADRLINTAEKKYLKKIKNKA